MLRLFCKGNMDFESLVGMTFTKVEKVDNDEGNDAIKFHTNGGQVFVLSHRQNCCESVYIESVVGDLSDLVDSEILRAEEATNNEPESEYGDIAMWTFYKIATRKGYVDIRFYGSSNGWYSVGVSLYEE